MPNWPPSDWNGGRDQIGISGRLRRNPQVEISVYGRARGQRGPVGLPIAVQAVDAQREHVFRVLDPPPGAVQLQALLRDITMRAFGFSRADWKPFGQGFKIF